MTLDFLIFRMDGDCPAWPRHVKLSEATQEQMNTANQRSQLPDELVLDVEDPVRLGEVVQRLDGWGWAFRVWHSGGRGNHVHITIPQLADMEPDQRRRARKSIIAACSCDEALASDSHLIQLEGRPHRRTGEPKRLLWKREKDQPNELPLFALMAAVQEPPAFPKVESTITREGLENDPLIKYALAHTVPSGIGRYHVLAKNIGILLARSPLSDAEAADLIRRIEGNMPGGSGYVRGWFQAAKAGKFTNYNRREVARWLRRNDGVLA